MVSQLQSGISKTPSGTTQTGRFWRVEWCQDRAVFTKADPPCCPDADLTVLSWMNEWPALALENPLGTMGCVMIDGQQTLLPVPYGRIRTAKGRM